MTGKTSAKIEGNVYQSEFKDGDSGYIDGYVAHETGIYAVFVRADGLIDFVKPHQLRAKGAK